MKFLKLAEGVGVLYAKNNALCVTFYMQKTMHFALRFCVKKSRHFALYFYMQKTMHFAVCFISKIYRILLIPNFKRTYNQRDLIHKEIQALY